VAGMDAEIETVVPADDDAVMGLAP